MSTDDVGLDLQAIAEQAPTPTRWRTLRTPEGLRPSPRQAQRDARQYAEAWLQALRDWHVRGRTEYISSRNLHSNRPPADGPRVVGQYTSGGSQAALSYREMSTPIGWVAESAITRACNESPHLGRIRAGGGLGSLIHSSGQGWNGEEARAYAVALLELAAHLGDERAIHHLGLLKLGL